jgi:hypothetical protein
MKPLALLFCLWLGLDAQAQNFESTGTFKLGAGYEQDYPGMNGYGLALEYIKPLNDRMEVSIGGRRMHLSGIPQTPLIEEYNKASSIDFAFYWLAVHTENHRVRIGPGYSFSFYSICQAYPQWPEGSASKTPVWSAQYVSGRICGLNVLAEYQYHLTRSACSFGLKAALYKSYDRTWFIGPEFGLDL